MPLLFIGTAAVSGLRCVKKSVALPLRVFAILWIVTFIVEVTGHVMRYFIIPNLTLYNVFDFFFYLGLASTYQQILRGRIIKKIILLFYPMFVVFVVINSLFIQGVLVLQTLTVVVGGSFVILFAVCYFWQLYESEETDPITRDPFFWFSFGLIVYLGGTLPFLGMLNYLWENFKEFTRYYFVYISNAFSIFLNILVTTGFLCRKSFLK